MNAPEAASLSHLITPLDKAGRTFDNYCEADLDLVGFNRMHRHSAVWASSLCHLRCV